MKDTWVIILECIKDKKKHTFDEVVEKLEDKHDGFFIDKAALVEMLNYMKNAGALVQTDEFNVWITRHGLKHIEIKKKEEKIKLLKKIWKFFRKEIVATFMSALFVIDILLRIFPPS